MEDWLFKEPEKMTDPELKEAHVTMIFNGVGKEEKSEEFWIWARAIQKEYERRYLEK